MQERGESLPEYRREQIRRGLRIEQSLLQSYPEMIAGWEGSLAIHSVLRNTRSTTMEGNDDGRFELPVGALDPKVDAAPGSLHALDSAGLPFGGATPVRLFTYYSGHIQTRFSTSYCQFGKKCP